MGTRLRTLGDVSLEGVRFTRPKSLLLLAFLALEGPQDRRHLAELFYPGAARPLGGLASNLARLRTGAPGTVGTDGARAWSSVECDAHVLLAACDAGDDRRAVDLYLGRFLDGLYLKNWSSELEEWVLGTREYLAGRVRDCRLRLARAAAARGAFEAAAGHAEAGYLLPGQAAPDPDELERIYLLLVAGDNPRAHEVQREAESYGIALDITAEAARELLAEGAGVTVSPHNLPSDSTSFVGRHAELAELTAQLDRDASRLLTLVGAGGAGKTRLALQLAREQLERKRFPDGVIFVPLEALTTPSGITTGIAAGLGIELREREDPLAQVARSIGDRRLLLLLDNFEHLIEARAVAAELVHACPNLTLVVTSRERLNLAEERVFSLEGLITPHPQQRVQYRDAITLFEHRARSADLHFRLTPEIVPEVLRICRLVAGSPLAIELAAVWVRILAPGEIAREIERNLDFLATPVRNVAERHRSIRAAFDHSWSLLTPREQAVLMRLSVFRGGFRREAAGDVANATIPVLASLVDKSLMRVLPSGRFDRHPLLYQFTQEKLAGHPHEEELRRVRHARYYLTLAKGAEPQLKGRLQVAWLDRLEEEFENFQSVLAWSIEHDRAILGLRLTDHLRRFWLVRGSSQLARAWLTRLLDQPRAQERSRVRARALRHAGILARDHGDYPAATALAHESVGILEELGDTAEIPKSLGLLGTVALTQGDDDRARALFEQCLAIARESDNASGVALALNHLGTVATRRGEVATARARFEESLAIARRLGDQRDLAIPLNNLGAVAELQGEVAAARERYQESLRIRQELGDKRGIATSLRSLGELASGQGEYAAARPLLERSLALYRDLDDRVGIAGCLQALAPVVTSEGHSERAVRLWGASEALREAIHVPMAPNERARFDSEMAVARSSLGEEAFVASWDEGLRTPIEQAIELACSE